MTNDTEAITEIQQRNATARSRVMNAASTENLEPPARIQAAMMELAAVWREEAAWFTEQKRKGHVGIAKELTSAAARLAGFAIGLTTRPVGDVRLKTEAEQLADWSGGSPVLAAMTLAMSTPGPVATGPGGPWKTADGTEYPTEEAMNDVSHAAYPAFGCTRHERCAALPDPFPKPMTPSETVADAAMADATLFIDPTMVCAHPLAQRSTLKSGVIMCTLCQAVVGQVDGLNQPLADLVPGSRPGPVVTGDPTMDYLTGAVSTYEPRERIITAAGLAAQPPLESFVTVVNAEPGDSTTFLAPPTSSSPGSRWEVLAATPAADNPFTSPATPGSNRAPVARLSYGELGPLIAATYPVPRTHLSHSYVESIGNCGLQALLSDASKGQHIGPRRPSWSLIGGSAFHTAIETIELASLQMGGRTPTVDMVEGGDWAKFWELSLTAAVDETTQALVGTPYANLSTWHVANRGLEGFDWWRVQGADMVARYLAHHNDAWRQRHTLLTVPADPASHESNGPRVPVLEFGFAVAAGGTAIRSEGFIDAAWLTTSPDYPVAALEVVDYKTGKSAPSEHFQLTEYGDVLRKHLPTNFALPVVGRFWLARKGEYTPPVTLAATPGRAEIDYRYQAADRAMRHAVFVPSPGNFCTSCTMVDYCPAQSGRDATGA